VDKNVAKSLLAKLAEFNELALTSYGQPKRVREYLIFWLPGRQALGSAGLAGHLWGRFQPCSSSIGIYTPYPFTWKFDPVCGMYYVTEKTTPLIPRGINGIYYATY